jgi:heme exporter protein C
MRLSDRVAPVLIVIAAIMLAAAPYVINLAPLEATMGLVQRIFYFHVPAAMTMLLTSIVAGLGSAWYLFRRSATADRIALAAAELAVLFGLMTLVTGPLWGRKAWGVWWTWDVRLTSTLVMWMVFNSYLLLRKFGGPGSEVLASAVGFFGMLLVPFVYFSVDFAPALHPPTSVTLTLPKPMAEPFLWCLVAFVVLYTALLLVRIRLEEGRAALEQAYRALED